MMNWDFLLDNDSPGSPYRELVQNFSGEALLPDGVLASCSDGGTVFSICGGKGVRWEPSPRRANGYTEILNLGEGCFLVVTQLSCTKEFSTPQLNNQCMRIGIRMSGSVEPENQPFLNSTEDNLLFVGVQGEETRAESMLIRANSEAKFVCLLLPLKQSQSLFDLDLPELADVIALSQAELLPDKTFFSIYRSSIEARRCANEMLSTKYSGYHRSNFLAAKAKEFICHFEYCLRDTKQTKSPDYKITAVDLAAIKKARKIIQNDPTSKLSRQMLADEVGMSLNRFASLFKFFYGQTVHDTVVAVRMEKARQLLFQTDLPVNEIASRVGYEGVSGFDRAYTKVFGVLPSRHRQIQ